jgi:hypothetical protein
MKRNIPLTKLLTIISKLLWSSGCCSAPDFGTDDVNDLTGADGLGGFLQLGEEVQVRTDFVAPNTDNDETEVKLFEILLVLQVAINRHEDIELLLG